MEYPLVYFLAIYDLTFPTRAAPTWVKVWGSSALAPGSTNPSCGNPLAETASPIEVEVVVYAITMVPRDTVDVSPSTRSTLGTSFHDNGVAPSNASPAIHDADPSSSDGLPVYSAADVAN
jgi:hypothetical protein